ncbi:ATP12 family chaperone protein [Pararhodospirillum oryzae]|uniref:ATPase n=1 Tax=Pararhodospirillum oryzae TaxID=478448 RepID=A0A512H520_9PROT|nr:ATP12 family protein [Pararhodospirillum oryzae]GEO80541.1 ATPase [Pararhodospirillum oryzae]
MSDSSSSLPADAPRPVTPPSRQVDKPLSATLRRRFYKTVAVAPEETGFGLRLDGKPVRTPTRLPLVAPTPALAEAMAGEWRAQGDTIEPETMPLTALANTALDRVMPAQEAVIAALVRYGDTDLLCYRAAEPPDLVARQDAAWPPLLAWAAETLGIRLEVTRGLMPTPQPAGSLKRLEASLAALDPWTLTVAQALTAITGSVILGLAVAHRRLEATEAFRISQIDDLFQAERWGEDAEATARHRVLEADARAAGHFLALCASDPARA